MDGGANTRGLAESDETMCSMHENVFDGGITNLIQRMFNMKIKSAVFSESQKTEFSKRKEPNE